MRSRVTRPAATREQPSPDSPSVIIGSPAGEVPSDQARDDLGDLSERAERRLGAQQLGSGLA